MLKLLKKESGYKEKIIVMEKVNVKAEAEAQHKEELKMVNIEEIKVIINNGIEVEVNLIMAKLLVIELEMIVQVIMVEVGVEIKKMMVNHGKLN